MRKFFFILFSVELFSLGLFIIVLFNYSPQSSDWGVKAIFFISALLWLAALITMIMIQFRRRDPRGPSTQTIVLRSIRQAVLIAIGIVGVAILGSTNVLNWLSFTVYLLALILIEIYLRSLGSPA